MGPHEKFLKLCALSTSGSMTEEEQKQLQEHLAVCSECREALKQFETVVDRGIPALASQLASDTPEENPSFSINEAEKAFFERLSEEDIARRAAGSAGGDLAKDGPVVPRRMIFHKSFDRFHFWLPVAAGVLLCATLGILTYRIGLTRGVDVAKLDQPIPRIRPAAPNEALDTVIRERDTANARLAERDKGVSELRREIALQSGEIAKRKAEQSERLGAQQSNDEEKKQLADERDRLAQQLTAEQVTLEASERKLHTLEQERSQDVLHAASLEGKVAELSRVVKDQAHTTDQQQELLAHDRDIRELMGARDLYVAEVYDVARTGETQKAFGRVFYTKGKSLIFYAYDLDGDPGWKNANAFQAWGTHGPDRTQAFNLGVFYEDNVSKKRWVLKFNDAKTLNQIDAVFVTVEPHGGSERPSGKPFLYAYLKMSANHP
jgi:predicted  nucleic acid-binding Zn-ribbon protein